MIWFTVFLISWLFSSLMPTNPLIIQTTAPLMSTIIQCILIWHMTICLLPSHRFLMIRLYKYLTDFVAAIDYPCTDTIRFLAWFLMHTAQSQWWEGIMSQQQPYWQCCMPNQAKQRLNWHVRGWLMWLQTFKHTSFHIPWCWQSNLHWMATDSQLYIVQKYR